MFVGFHWRRMSQERAHSLWKRQGTASWPSVPLFQDTNGTDGTGYKDHDFGTLYEPCVGDLECYILSRAKAVYKYGHSHTMSVPSSSRSSYSPTSTTTGGTCFNTFFSNSQFPISNFNNIPPCSASLSSPLLPLGFSPP